MQTLYTYKIYQDNELIKEFKNEPDDTKMFGYMLRNQGNSINYAIKYGGYKIEIINQTTEEKETMKPYF